jgi:hypothetical protein
MTTKAVAYIFPPQTWIQVGGMDEGAELGHVVSHPEGSQEAQSLATKCVQNRGLFCMHFGGTSAANVCSKLEDLGAHSGHIVRHRNRIVMNSLRALSLNE